jgi:hypothetical protein
MSSARDVTDAARWTRLTGAQGRARALAALSDVELDAWIATCSAMDNRAEVANSAHRQWKWLRQQAPAQRDARRTIAPFPLPSRDIVASSSRLSSRPVDTSRSTMLDRWFLLLDQPPVSRFWTASRSR